MNIIKTRLRRKTAPGIFDAVHLETSSGLVIRPDGGTVESRLQEIGDELDRKVIDLGAINQEQFDNLNYSHTMVASIGPWVTGHPPGYENDYGIITMSAYIADLNLPNGMQEITYTNGARYYRKAVNGTVTQWFKIPTDVDMRAKANIFETVHYTGNALANPETTGFQTLAEYIKDKFHHGFRGIYGSISNFEELHVKQWGYGIIALPGEGGDVWNVEIFRSLSNERYFRQLNANSGGWITDKWGKYITSDDMAKKADINGIYIAELSSPSQLTVPGEYHIGEIKNIFYSFADCTVGDFHGLLLANNFNENGCMYGTLILTSPRLPGTVWVVRIWEGKFTKFRNISDSEIEFPLGTAVDINTFRPPHGQVRYWYCNSSINGPAVKNGSFLIEARTVPGVGSASGIQTAHLVGTNRVFVREYSEYYSTSDNSSTISFGEWAENINTSTGMYYIGKSIGARQSGYSTLIEYIQSFLGAGYTGIYGTVIAGQKFGSIDSGFPDLPPVTEETFFSITARVCGERDTRIIVEIISSSIPPEKYHRLAYNSSSNGWIGNWYKQTVVEITS